MKRTNKHRLTQAITQNAKEFEILNQIINKKQK